MRASRNRHYAMIVLNLAIVAVVSVVFFLHESGTVRRWEIVSTYHLASANSAETAAHELALLQNDILAGAVTGDTTIRGGDETLTLATGDRLYRLSQTRQALAELQRKFALPELAYITALTDSAFVNFLDIVRNRKPLTLDQDLLDAIKVLDLRLHQLERLNLAAANSAAIPDNSLHAIGERTLLALFVVLVGLAGFVTTGIVRRLEAASVERAAAVVQMHEFSNSLDAFFAGAPAGMAVIDRDLNCTKWNDTLERISEKNVSDFQVGCRILDVLPLEDARALTLAFQHTFESGEPYLNMEISVPAKSGDGPNRHWVSSHFPIRGETGETEALGLVVTDVTEQRIVSDALKTTAENLENAQRIAKLGSWDWDILSNREEWSDQVFQVYGLKPGAFQPDGYSYLDYVHPDDRDAMLAAQEKARLEGTPLNIEYRSIGADGVERYLQAQGEIEFDANGSPVRMAGTLQDATERNLAEQELEDAFASLTHAQKLAKMGSWVWDLESGEVSGSEEMYRIYGLDPDGPPLTMDRFLECVHPDDAAGYQAAVRNSEEERRPYKVTYRVEHADGRTLIVEEQGEFTESRPDSMPLFRGTVQDVTEHRHMEQALRESEELFRGAFDQAAVGILLTETDGRFTRANPKMCEIFGYSTDELVGMTYLDVTHPDDIEASANAHDDLRKGKVENIPIEKRYLRKDGTVIWARVTISYMRDDEGNHLGNIGFVEDIDDRKKAERALAETTQNLAEAQRIGQIGSWELDSESGVLMWSDTNYRLLGLDPETFTPTYDALLEMIHPDDRESMIARNNQMIAGSTVEPIEYRVIRPNGETRILQSRGEIVRNADGTTRRIRGTVQDITERKRAEQALRDSEARLDAFFNQAPAGMVIYDSDGRYAKINEPFARVTGHSAEEVIGKKPSEVLLSPAFAKRVEEVNRKVLESGETVSDFEFSVHMADGGGLRTFDSTRFPIAGPSGKTVSAGAVALDITERRQAEEEAARAARYLDLLFKHSLTSFVLMDRDFNFIRVNDAYATADGKDPEFFPGKNHFDIYPSEARPLFEEVRDSGKPYQALAMAFEYAEHPERGTTWWDWTLIPVADADGVTELMVFSLNNVTERVQTELALHNSEERLDAFFNKAPISLGIVDSDHRYIKLNEALASMNGAAAEDHIGERPGDVMPPEKAVLVEDLLKRTLEHGESIDSEESIVPGPDGAFHYRVYTQFPLSGDPQKPDTVGVIVRDVTERRRVEQALQESEERLNAFFTDAPVGLGIIDSERRYLNLNETLARSNGLPVADHIGKAPSDLFPAEMAKMVESVMDRTLVDGQTVNDEAGAVTPGGKTQYWAFSQFPLPGDDKTRGALGVATVDITDLKEAQRELAVLADNLNESQRIAKLGSWVWNIEEDEEWWSDEIYRIRGMEINPKIESGYEYLDYMHPDDRERVGTALEKSLKDNLPYAVEYRVQHPDGHEIIFSEHAETEYDETGKPVCMRGTTQDITERKRIEEELAKLNSELETRVDERTAELRDAQAELVKSERLSTLGQLTATVSHELRNPLGAMRTSMYVVEKKTEGQSDSITRAIGRVNRSITRCDQIIDELLDYTRIRSLDIRAVPLDDWLADLLDEQAVPDDVEIRRKFGAPSVRAPADVDRLRRAVINVYENACHALTSPHHDATPRNRNLLTVETRVRKDRFEIVITDNGPGIPADLRQKVFEPLFSTKNFGVGLGLPTVAQIMEQHGGGINVSKNRGGGAKFSLWLPMMPVMEMSEA